MGDLSETQFMAVSDGGHRRVAFVHYADDKWWRCYAWPRNNTTRNLTNWPPAVGRQWETVQEGLAFLRSQGYSMIPVPHRDTPQVMSVVATPIEVTRDSDPVHIIEMVANDLVHQGDAELRRAGRRLLGCVDALWAERGADPLEPADDLITAINEME